MLYPRGNACPKFLSSVEDKRYLVEHVLEDLVIRANTASIAYSPKLMVLPFNLCVWVIYTHMFK